MSEPIRFVASVEKVQTLMDGAIRVYLDIPETALLEMAQLVECKIKGQILEIFATPINSEESIKKKSYV